MNQHLAGSTPAQLHARPPAVPPGAISGLRIQEVLLVESMGRMDLAEAGGAMGALGDRGVVLKAQAIVQRQARRHLPCVLPVEVKIVAADRSGADVGAI